MLILQYLASVLFPHLNFVTLHAIVIFCYNSLFTSYRTNKTFQPYVKNRIFLSSKFCGPEYFFATCI